MHLCRWPWPMLPPMAENVLLVCAPAWCCYVDVWRLYCHWAHIHLSVLVATPGNSDVFDWTLTDSHTWVHDLFLVRVCVDICAWVTSGDYGKSGPWLPVHLRTWELVPSLTIHLRGELIPFLGDVALAAWTQESQPPNLKGLGKTDSIVGCHKGRRDATPHYAYERDGPDAMCLEYLVWTLTWGWQSQWSPEQTDSVITQTHIQGFELAHPNIYPTCDLLKLMKLSLFYGTISTGSSWL